MTAAGLRLANQARREAGEAGLAAASYIKRLRMKDDEANAEWRASMAYELARSAASKAREFIAYTEGRLHYPAAESA